MNTQQHNSAFTLTAAVILAALGAGLAAALLYGTGSQITRAAREIRYEKSFFIAEAGLERAKAELRSGGRTLNNVLLGADGTGNTADDGLPLFGALVNFGGGMYQVRITDNSDSDASLFVDTDDTVIICSTGTYENISRVLEAAVLVEERIFPPPTPDGALGVYGTNTAITLGNNTLIDGRDYDPPTNFFAAGIGCEGTLTTNPAVPGVFSTESTSITGTNQVTGDIITNGTSQFSTNYWQEQADALIPQATVTLTGGTYNSIPVGYLGTRDNPQVTVVSGNSRINASIDGAGILIVMNGVELDLGGNFHYEGIVILLGSVACTELGNARIFGALVSVGGGVNVELKGTAEMMYSSAALANLSKLPLNPQPLSVVYWREIK